MTIPIVLPMERETISKSVRESRARRREPSERGVQTSTSYGPGPCGTEPGLRSGWHSSSVTRTGPGMLFFNEVLLHAGDHTMFWKPRRTRNVAPIGAKTLRVESLETRRMLSGVVQVNLDGLGNLSLVGDSSQHYVEITSTPNGTYDQFTITSKDGTLFELNGVLPTLTSVAVDGVTGNINVNLGNGGPNTFDFEAPSTNAGAVSTVLGNLYITNNSVETNKINNVVIQGNLSVVDGSNGYHEFDALGTQVNGYTEINNFDVASGPTYQGDSYTDIINSVFEGLNVKSSESDPPVLTIDNGVGNNQIFIQGQTPVAPQTTSLSTTQIGFVTSALLPALRRLPW